MDNEQLHYEEMSYQSTSEEEEENKEEIARPSKPTVIGSAQLQAIIDLADQTQVRFCLPHAHLRDMKSTGEPELYAEMNFHEARMPFLVVPTGADMRKAIFDDAHLQQAQFPQVHLEEASFHGAYAPGMKAEKAHMQMVNLMGANLTKASFKNANMTQAKMDKVILSKANLNYADLTHAHIPWGTLTGVFAKGTKFIGANLSAAKMQGARFIDCDFTEADLSQANLTNALFVNCNLSNTKMAMADLTGLLVRLDKGDKKANEKAYEMLVHANWGEVRLALFRIIRRTGKVRAIASDLRDGRVPKQPIWKAWELPEPIGNLEQQYMRHDPLLATQLFLNVFHDSPDPRYNKAPFVTLIKEWFDKFNEFNAEMRKPKP